MYPDKPRKRPVSAVFNSVLTIVLAAGMLYGSQIAFADPTITEIGLCPADTVGQNINCTANDVIVAEVTAQGSNIKCVTGDTTSLPLTMVFQINSGSERDDIAAWFPTPGELGKNMLLTSANGGPASCYARAADFPIVSDESSSILVDDLDGDNCGDVVGITESFHKDIANAEVLCQGSVGGAAVDAVVSWFTSGNDPVCIDHQDYGDFSKSKCSHTISFVDLQIVGKLTVCKAAAVGTDGDFEFTIEQGDVWVEGTGGNETPTDATSPFYLNPADGTNGVVCTTFDVITDQPDAPNTVTITETGVPAESDFAVSDVSCVNNTPGAGGGAATFTNNGDGFTINLTEGDLGTGGTDPGQSEVTCTVTNTEGGSLTIVKDAVPDSAQDFSFSGDLGDFDLDDDADGTLPNSFTADNLTADDYSVTESQPATWTLTDVSCSDAEGSVDPVSLDLATGALTVHVDNGQNVTCVFTNVQQGMAVVQKVVLPDTDTTSFTFSGDVSGSAANGETLQLVVPVPPATGLTSQETVPAGWDLASIVCDDGDSTGDVATATATFNVAPGEVVTCVFTNVLQGAIVVAKEAIGGDDEFGFTASFADPFSITTTGGAGSMSFPGISASDEVAETTYSVDETGLPGGWDFDGATCDDGSDPAAIDVDPGETVTCTFTNTKWSSITVLKQAFGPDDSFCFDITPPLAEPFEDCIDTVDGHGSTGGTHLDLGTWSIEEVLPEQTTWMLASAHCDNGDDPSAIDLQAGDDVTCTFTNVIPAPVPAASAWTLVLLIIALLAMGWYFRPAVMRRF